MGSIEIYHVSNEVKHVKTINIGDTEVVKMRSYKGRDIPLGTRVKVYRNLTNKCFSIVAAEGEYKGLVVYHADMFSITEATFSVNMKGRARVRANKKKEVHAYILGKLGSCFEERLCDTEITYNPYDTFHETFYYVEYPRYSAVSESLVQFEYGKAYAI